MPLWKLTQTGLQGFQRTLATNAINYCSLTTWVTTKHIPEQVNGSSSTKPFQIIKRNAGHSKWANIKHVKAAKDKLRHESTMKVLQKIKSVVKQTGSYNLELNTRLAKAFEEGKRQNIPASKMTEFLKKLQNSQDNSQTLYFEGKGPGNVIFIFQTVTDKPKIMRNTIHSSYKNHGGQLGTKPISSSHAFDFKGFVRVAKAEIEDLEKAMDIAIECEAEDVREVEGEDGQTEYEFICDGNEVQKVQSKIVKQNINVSETSEVFVPNNVVSISPDQRLLIEKFYNKINDLEDLTNIFHNINEDEEL